MKRGLKLGVLLSLLLILATPFVSSADEFRRLEDNISSLKEKIRTSSTKDPKDIQRLYRLENELEKKMYLKKNSASKSQ